MPHQRTAPLLALLACGALHAQSLHQDRDFETRITGGLGIGFQAPKLDTTNLSNASGYPGFGLLPELGAALTYRDRIGLSVAGIFGYNTYGYYVDTVCYYARHITQRAEVRLFYQMENPLPFDERLQVGLAYGITWQEATTFGRTVQGFTVVNSAPSAQMAYLAPELMMVASDWMHRFEFGLRYVVHIDQPVALVNTATRGTEGARFTATNDQLVAVARYHFGFQRSPPPPPPLPTMDLAQRHTDTLTTLATAQRRITLWLWDNAEYDGDTISVLLNGAPLLTGHELTDRRHKLRIDLPQGTNQLLIVAHNEGRVPPNTASGLVRYGKGKRELLIRTSLKTNQLVVVQRK